MKKYLVCLLVLFTASVAFAMGGGGGGSSPKMSRALEGKITDEKGEKLQGAQITLFRVDAAEVEQAKTAATDGEKTLSTTSGKNGKYKFIAVRPGFYRVRIAMEGYQTIEKLMEFKRGSKDAVLNVSIEHIEQEATSSTGNPE